MNRKKRYLKYDPNEKTYSSAEFQKLSSFSNGKVYGAIGIGSLALVKVPSGIDKFKERIPQREVDRLIKEGRLTLKANPIK